MMQFQALLESKEIVVEGSNSREHQEQCVLNQRVSTIRVFEDVPAELVKVPEHELSADSTGGELNLHPLAPRIPLDEAREATNSG